MEVGRHRYVFNNAQTVIKLQVKNTKQCILYSTQHHSTMAEANSRKPMVVFDYNTHKFGVDIFDQLVGQYNLYPVTKRWPVALFSWVNIVCGNNALVMYKKSHPEEDVGRRTFLFDLSQALMAPQRQRMVRKNHWAEKIYRSIRESYDELQSKLRGENPSLVFKCYICKKSKRAADIPTCFRCNKNVCSDCSRGVMLCVACYN